MLGTVSKHPTEEDSETCSPYGKEGEGVRTWDGLSAAGPCGEGSAEAHGGGGDGKEEACVGGGRRGPCGKALKLSTGLRWKGKQGVFDSLEKMLLFF